MKFVRLVQFIQAGPGHEAHERHDVKTDEQPNHGINVRY